MRLFMTHSNNSAIVVPINGDKNPDEPLAQIDSAFGIVLQGKFATDGDREEFLQTITSHGITFLRCANFPLPKPSRDDLSIIEKLARVLCGIWGRKNAEVSNDAG
jgi:hypothetical protein